MVLFKLAIAYDGSSFFGWQKTATGPSIQETLQKAILDMTQESVTPEAASRTDRGVHAEGQVVAIELEKQWPAKTLLKGLNAHLPPEVRILNMEEKSEPFHPSLDAVEKEYHYRVSCGDVQHPIHRLYAWHFHSPLDREAMARAAELLVGTRDFSAFAGEPEEQPVCTLRQIEFSELSENRLQISLVGDRFLYKMARTLAGTLIYVGAGKLIIDALPEIIASRKRERAGVTAPAHGLFLHRVAYAES